MFAFIIIYSLENSWQIKILFGLILLDSIMTSYMWVSMNYKKKNNVNISSIDSA